MRLTRDAKEYHGSSLTRLQVAHSPLDIPQESLFTEEQLRNLALITSEEFMRVGFAKIVYFLDIMVRSLEKKR